MNRCSTTLLLQLAILSCTMEILNGFDFKINWRFTLIDVADTSVVPYPDTDRRFRSDYTPLGNDTSVVFPNIRSGKVVFVDGKTFNLATDIERTCLSDFDRCSRITWSFYLNIKSWNDAEYPVIMRTTPIDKSGHGFYIGRGDGDNILFYFRGSSGKTHSITLSQNHFWNEWERVIISYFGSVGVIVTVGTSTSTVLQRTVTDEIPTLNNGPTNLVVGSTNGPSFYLDDIALGYDNSEFVEVTTTTPTTTTATTPATTTTTTTRNTLTTANSTSANPTTTDTSASKPTEIQNSSTLSPTITTKLVTSSINTVEFYWRFWLPILVVAVVIAVIITSFICLCCKRKKRRKSHRINDQNGVQLHDMRNGYSLAPQVDSATELDPNMTEDTDG